MTSANKKYLLATLGGKRPPAPRWFEEALARSPERSHFTSEGAKIELLVWGQQGRPGLLLLHGNGAHADWWSPIAPHFADDFRVAAISWSGMGRSDRRARGYTVDDFAQEARDAIAAAGLDLAGPPLVVGHSLGGIAAMRAAGGFEGIGGLVLVDSPLGLPVARLEEMKREAPRAHPAHLTFASLSEGLARFRLSPSQSCPNLFMIDHIARLSLIESPGGWQWHFDPRRVAFDLHDGRRQAAKVSCPIAYFHGDSSALVEEAALAHTLAVLPEGTPVVCIPGAAHHVPLDQPLALIAALRTLFATWPPKAPARKDATPTL